MLSFLTRIPVGKIKYSEDKFEKSINLTSIVGVIIGLILLLVSMCLKTLENRLVVGFILTLTYIFITGGLHLDGLSDSFDGLFSGRNKERILEIMKDSRVGAFGVLSLILIVIGYTIFLGESNYVAIFIMPIVGRCNLYIVSKISVYGKEAGLGKIFVEKGATKNCLTMFITVNLLCVIICIITSNFIAILGLLVSYIVVIKLVKFTETKIDGVTGDILGMIVEISQISWLISSYILINVIGVVK
jgi:adenosylcobinamide-GDP ribazoletransferase